MNKTWYAIMMDENDNDWGMGSYNKEEAIEQVKRDYPEEGWIAVIDEAINKETGETESTVMIDKITHENIFDILTTKGRSKMPIFKRHKPPEQTTAPKTYTTPSGSAPAIYVDILRQPHTLIAGTTGSGKSCAINGIIYTALYKSPVHTRFILIDPKRTELVMYRNLPHTIAYTSDPGEALKILNNAVAEIDSRYDRATAKGLKKSDEADIYIIIDELSDLIFSEPRTAQTLGKIARIGRAANVHLIAATQCPNRKTLSAEFAANCPARLALRCREKIESRQIIGNGAAVTLPQYGYAYYQAPQYTTLQLVKIPYYTDNILLERARFWEKQK